MKPDTVIFDMDGLLIDSEPLWQEAADEILSRYGINLSHEQYITTTGLRTKEFLAWWFGFFKVKIENLEEAEELITRVARQRPDCWPFPCCCEPCGFDFKRVGFVPM